MQYDEHFGGTHSRTVRNTINKQIRIATQSPPNNCQSNLPSVHPVLNSPPPNNTHTHTDIVRAAHMHRDALAHCKFTNIHGKYEYVLCVFPAHPTLCSFLIWINIDMCHIKLYCGKRMRAMTYYDLILCLYILDFLRFVCCWLLLRMREIRSARVPRYTHGYQQLWGCDVGTIGGHAGTRAYHDVCARCCFGKPTRLL